MKNFLLDVWQRVCGPEDFVVISTKKGTQWKDHSFQFKDARQKIPELLKQYPPEKYDVYFCPVPFKHNKRSKSDALPVSILWADIDHGSTTKVPPSILWESSPGRHQGIWFLPEKLPPSDIEVINKALSYSIGADKGGWDLTQVLRLPGTFNHKYPGNPPVKLLKGTGKTYDPDKLVKSEPTVTVGVSAHGSEAILSKYRKVIPRKVLQLLLQKRVDKGKRSDILWYIENKLKEAGLTPQEIIALVKESQWNKYKGRHDEEIRLRSELEKVIENKIETERLEDAEEEAEGQLASLNFESFADVMSDLSAYPGWLVDGFWLRESHGIVAGEPKSFKSTLVTDMAISIASGKSFLGQFPVMSTGPVLYLQNENSRWIMKDRMEKITASKKLGGTIKHGGNRLHVRFGNELPIYFVNQQGFLFSDPLHQQILKKAIAEYKPILIIFDPIYLMFDGDLNSAKELNPVLSFLLEIKEEFGCGILLVHHWNKGGTQTTSRGGQRMLGSTTLHGWIESAWYIGIKEPVPEDDEEHHRDVNKVSALSEVTIEREFRGAGVHPKLDCTIKMGEFGSAEYEVHPEIHKKKQKGKPVDEGKSKKEVHNRLLLSGVPMSIRSLASECGLARGTTEKIVDQLIKEKKAKYMGNKVISIGGPT